MPLTDKGRRIMAEMKDQYGEEKGEQVFYASKNAGKIKGVDSFRRNLGALDQVRRALTGGDQASDQTGGDFIAMMSNLARGFLNWVGEEGLEAEHPGAPSNPYAARPGLPPVEAGIDDTPSAAGTMLMAPDGRALFVRRAQGRDAAGTWAFPGGMREGDETPDQTAIRETHEEVGDCGLGPRGLVPLDDREVNNVRFATYVAPVPSAFQPTLDEEHDAYNWQLPDDAPQPLHPGVQATFDMLRTRDAAPVTAASAAAPQARWGVRAQRPARDWQSPRQPPPPSPDGTNGWRSPRFPADCGPGRDQQPSRLARPLSTDDDFPGVPENSGQAPQPVQAMPMQIVFSPDALAGGIKLSTGPTIPKNPPAPAPDASVRSNAPETLRPTPIKPPDPQPEALKPRRTVTDRPMWNSPAQPSRDAGPSMWRSPAQPSRDAGTSEGARKAAQTRAAGGGSSGTPAQQHAQAHVYHKQQAGFAGSGHEAHGPAAAMHQHARMMHESPNPMMRAKAPAASQRAWAASAALGYGHV